MLDFSTRAELAGHAAVIADIEAACAELGTPCLIVGAFARDLHLFHGHGIETQRETGDVDIALAVSTWLAFNALKDGLIQSGAFTASPRSAHRLLHRGALPVDLVPFGAIETPARRIDWPPRGEINMDVFGFREALATSQELALPGNVRSRLASLPALALLKLVCWQDRHIDWPGKDAHDLRLIVRNYLQAGNQDRLWSEFPAWTEDEHFDYELAGARMLGHDMRAVLDEAGIDRVAGILSRQSGADVSGALILEMNSHEPEKARALLEAMMHGMLEYQWK